MWRFPSAETVMQDVRYGLRMLRRSPMFTAVAVLSLGIGIGAAAAVFSLADAMLVRKLPVPAPDDLVLLRWTSGPVFPAVSLNGYSSQTDDGLSSTSFSHVAFTRMRDDAAPLADVFGFADLYRINIGLNGRAELGTGHAVSGNYFEALGIQAAHGRALGPADDRADAPPAAVISHAFWAREFGGSTSAIGRTVAVNGLPFTIAGILPPGFSGTGQAATSPDLYVPLAAYGPVMRPGDPVNDPNTWWVLMMARLRDGVEAAQVQPVLDLVLKQTVAAAKPALEAADLPRVFLEPGARGQRESRSEMREPLQTMGIVVGIVLLVACANVASLLLARGRARVRELTVRVAVGAPRRRVVRQLMTEGLLLAAIGSAVGLVLAHWTAAALLPALATLERPADAGIGIDGRVTAFVVLLASVCAILFSLAPALRATRLPLVAGLQESGRGSAASRQRGGLSAALVIGQIALSLVLLATAVLLIQSVRRLQDVDLGFDPRNVLIFRIDPSLNGTDVSRRRQMYTEILDRLRATGGVLDATLTSHTLIAHSSAIGVAMRPDETAPVPGSAEARPFRSTHRAWRLIVDPRFFSTLRIPLVRGRTFDSGDTAASRKVAVINRALALQMFQTEDAIGRQIRLGMFPTPDLYDIVGISADARYTSVRDAAPPTIYLPVAQQPIGAATFEVRAAGDPGRVAIAAREIVRSIDPSLPLFALRRQDEQIAVSLSREVLFARLAALLGGVTVALSAIGLYALLAYAVTRRTAEIGIRLALGAGRASVRWMILKQSLVLAGCGLALGIAGAAAGSKVVEALLFQVQPRDPLAIGAAAVLMLAVSLAAGYIPARRASRVDPLVSLRAE